MIYVVVISIYMIVCFSKCRNYVLIHVFCLGQLPFAYTDEQQYFFNILMHLITNYEFAFESNNRSLEYIYEQICRISPTNPQHKFTWECIRNVCKKFGDTTNQVAWRILYALMCRAIHDGDVSIHSQITHRLEYMPLSISSDDLVSVFDFLARGTNDIPDECITKILNIFMTEERPPRLWMLLIRLFHFASDEFIGRWIDTVPTVSEPVLLAIAAHTTESPSDTRNIVWELCYSLLRKRVNHCNFRPWGNNITTEMMHGGKDEFSTDEIHTLVRRVHEVCMKAHTSRTFFWARELFCAEMLSILYGYYMEHPWGKLQDIPKKSKNKIVTCGQEHNADERTFEQLFLTVKTRK